MLVGSILRDKSDRRRRASRVIGINREEARGFGGRYSAG